MRIISLLFTLILLASVSIPLAAKSQGAQFPVISADELKAELDSGKSIFLVDVRSRDEYSRGHLPGALNVPPEAFTNIAAYLPQKKDHPIVLYCRGWG